MTKALEQALDGLSAEPNLENIRFIQHHGTVRLNKPILDEHWIVNGKRFDYYPSREEVELAYSSKTEAAEPVDLWPSKDEMEKTIKKYTQYLFDLGDVTQPRVEAMMWSLHDTLRMKTKTPHNFTHKPEGER